MQRRPMMEALIALSLSAPLIAACDRSADSVPKLAKLGKFSLKDQDGKSFTEASLQGKVWLAAFLFTRCPSTCPRIMRYLRKVQETAKKEGVPVHIVTFSVDPENDTPEVLRNYGTKYGVDFSSWSLLTGDYDVVKKTSVEGFKLSLEGKANPEKDGFGILHGSHLVLVDRDLTIRGYYSTDEEKTIARLLKDARGLGEEG